MCETSMCVRLCERQCLCHTGSLRCVSFTSGLVVPIFVTWEMTLLGNADLKESIQTFSFTGIPVFGGVSGQTLDGCAAGETRLETQKAR